MSSAQALPCTTNTVCILAAGSGTRMGPYGVVTHKALVPVGNAAAISHIIEKFLLDLGARTRFVIAVGYCADDVVDYVKLAHPEICAQFVTVEDYAAPGSGPGASVLACRKQLRTPFYLACCDTLWGGLDCPRPIAERDWIAVAPVPPGAAADYCNVETDGVRVLGFRDKSAVAEDDFVTFTGLAHIARHEAFFDALAATHGTVRSLELFHGFTGLMGASAADSLFLCPMSEWEDIGTLARYEAVDRRHGGRGFRKHGELFFQVGSRVIKFYEEREIVDQRVQRARLLGPVVPPVVGVGTRLYASRFVPGTTLAECATAGRLSALLLWLEEQLWRKVDVDDDDRTACGLAFYCEKTLGRVKSYLERQSAESSRRELVRVESLLESVSWDELAEVEPVTFHGDLQLANIVVLPDEAGFCLIDWRQDFAGELGWGDLYYDLAKLLASIELDFSAGKEAGPESQPLRACLEEFVLSRGLSMDRVRLIAALVYINMAGIHLAPFDAVVFEFGMRRLERALHRTNSGAIVDDAQQAS